MNSEVSRMPEPQRALLGFLRFDPVTNEPRRQLSDAIQKRASRKLARLVMGSRLLVGNWLGHC